MGEKPGEMRSDQIKRSIDVERSDLEGNIQQLEHKVKTAMDWRAQFQKNPMTMIGLAFGGGVLLSTAIGGVTHRGLEGDAGNTELVARQITATLLGRNTTAAKAQLTRSKKLWTFGTALKAR